MRHSADLFLRHYRFVSMDSHQLHRPSSIKLRKDSMSSPLSPRFGRFQDVREFLKEFPMLVYLVRGVRRFVAAGVRLAVIAFEALAELFNGKKNFRILTKTQCTYFGDRFATTHHVAFLHDHRFVKAYNEAFEGIPDSVAFPIKRLDIAWRAHICTWAATQALSLNRTLA